MKKFLALVLALAMVLGMTACGQKEEAPAPAPEAGQEAAPAPAPEVSGNFVMGTGGVSGSWYPMGGGICGAMTKGKVNVTVQASGGGVENVRTILAGERDFGMAATDVAYYGYNSEQDFEGEDGTMLRSVFKFCPNYTQLLVRADSGINCVADLKGKAVGCGATGSGDEITMRTLLEAVGLTYDDVDEYLISVAEQATAFKDRKIDSCFIGAAAPTSGILDAASQTDAKLLAITGEEADAFIELRPFYSKATLSKDAYSFMTEDVEMMVLDTYLLCSTALTDEQVYTVLDNMFASIEDVQATHTALESLTLESACAGDFVVPLHDGAVKFYQDKGVL